MEDRLLTHAGTGVQVHFGTDHDHVADYRPLLDPLGLTGVIATVVASEMSPVMRGHINAYPLVFDGALPNAGAWPWWRERVQTTEEEFRILRARYGGDLEPAAGVVLQVNHPIGIGLGDLADWTPGRIGRPDFWTDDFDAMEVLNGGHFADYLDIFMDLVARGHALTPVGVTDSHRHFSGGVGLNGTWIGLGTDDPGAYRDDALREAFGARRTVVGRGVFLATDLVPGSVITGPTALEVEARSASWAKVDRLVLWRDGAPVEIVEGTSARFDLSPDRDAFYAVIAEGDQNMSPVFPGSTAWAMSSPVFLDLDGDGWQPPLGPLELAEPPPTRPPGGLAGDGGVR